MTWVWSRGIPWWHCGDDRNTPPLWPGSRSHPSACSRVYLWEGDNVGSDTRHLQQPQGRLNKRLNHTLIMTNLWCVTIDGKRQAQHFSLFLNRCCSHCIFRLDCILTLLWYMIAVCFISHCRTAVRNRWGTQHPSLPPGTNTPQANLKSSR